MEALIRRMLCLFCIIYLRSDKKTLAEPILVSNSTSVIENGTFTMQCITNETLTIWRRNSNDNNTASVGIRGGNCISASFIRQNSNMFDYSCNNSYILTLKLVSRYQNGETWQCRAGTTLTYSNKTVLHVLVPVMYVTIQSGNNDSVFTTQENTRNMLTCISSYSRPAANITWYITDWLGENNQKVLENSNSTYESDLGYTRSSTELYLNRTYNGWMLVCMAKNIAHYTGVFHNISLNITYPPYVNNSPGKTFTVKKGDTFNYTCTVVPGNPSSTNITWGRSNDTKTWNSSELLILNATKDDDSVYTCYASYMMDNSNGTIKIGNVSGDIRLIVKLELEEHTEERSGNSASIGAAGGSAAGLLLLGAVVVSVVIFMRRMKNKPPDESDASAALYVNVKHCNQSRVKQDSNPSVISTDRVICENAELGKTKNHRSNGEATSQAGVYVNFSKKRRTEKQMTKQAEFAMQTISSDIKATTRRSTAAFAPPPILSKTEFAGVLCKVDDDEDNDDAIPSSNDENIYDNSTEKIERIENVFVNELSAFVAGKSIESFATEFRNLPKGITMPCSVAVKPENIKLNRYNGIFPYDHSRVTKSDEPDFFINACYMDGYMKEKCYIASLGPTADTTRSFKTFWEMVWHEQSDILVMVTNLREITGMKCEQYWPKFRSSNVYGEVTVTCRNVEEYAEYTVRTFNVSQAIDNRMVTQLHFTAWPDKGVPDDLTSLLEFRQRINSTPSNKLGPVIVHCSAGIGRTGTLIALDRLIAEGKATKSINVSNCVRSMRHQRVNMVQTLEQYAYIYKVCVYALAFECECITAETFHDKFKATTDGQFGEQFEKLKTMVANESDDENKATLNKKEAKSNRPTADKACDRYRVRLFVHKSMNDSDYINAVYINSFKTKNKFVAAQTPLNEFVQDFISMICQEQCICVVDMDGNTPSKLDVGVYIPTVNQSFKFAEYTISSDKLDSNPKYSVNKLKVENTGKFSKGEWTAYHFKYHDWKHGEDTPTDPSGFVEFVNEVDDYATQFGEKESRVLVHCLDASRRSGLFCLVACLLEKVQCERHVNIGNTLRQVRTRRKTTINNANQLKFCYKTVDAFVEMDKTK